MQEDFSQNVLQTIEQRNLSPKPRWRFVLKDVFLWALWAFSLILGSITFSAIVFFFVHDGFLFSHLVRHQRWMESVQFIPIFWMLVFGLFFTVSYWNAIKTKHGYRFHASVVGANIVLSVLFGSSLYFFGFGSMTDCLAGRHLPLYRVLEDRQRMVWIHPEKGFLGGTIVSLEQENDFQLRDVQERLWMIKNASDGETMVVVGNRVHVLGTLFEGEAYTFVARDIFPWKAPQQSYSRFLQRADPESPKGHCGMHP